MSKKPTQNTAETETQKAAPAKNKITPLKKLSVKTVCGALKMIDFYKPQLDAKGVQLVDAKGAGLFEPFERKLCRIAGTANAVDSGESTYGTWEALLGEFAATDYATGEIFVGKSAFIPGAMGEALIAAIGSAQREDAASTLKFSVDIFAVVSPRDENKYEYIVRPVIESDVRNEAVALLGLAD